MTQQVLTRVDGKSRFAALAVSTDPTRFFIDGCECVEYEGKMALVATDGCRLHIAPIDRNPDDYDIGSGYRPIKVLKKSVDFVKKETGNYQFPAFERVIPDKFTGEPLIVSIPAAAFKEPEFISTAYTKIVRWLPDERTINFSYLAALAGETWTLKLSAKKEAMLCAADDGKIAVIAFIKME